MGVNASMYNVGAITMLKVPVSIGHGGTFIDSFAVLGVTTSKPANAWPSDIVTVPTLERQNLLKAKILE
jgi:hypothetical protein